MGGDPRKLTDEYEISEVLGRGGFSVVRKGTRKSSGERTEVAIKTLRRMGAWNQPASSRKQVVVCDVLVAKEIVAMRKIVEKVSPHENVIDLHDVYEDSNGVHLVLQL